MTTMPSQVTGHPLSPWMDLPPSSSAINAANQFSDCGNGSLVIDITPVEDDSDGETPPNNPLLETPTCDSIISEESAGRGPKSCVPHAERDVVRSYTEDCFVLDNSEKVTGQKKVGGQETMNDVIEIDPILEEGETAEGTPAKDVNEATADDHRESQNPEKDVYVISMSDAPEVTVICPDSEDDAEKSPETDANSGNVVTPSIGQGTLNRVRKSNFYSVKRRNVNGESKGLCQDKPSQSTVQEANSFDVSTTDNMIQQTVGQDTQGERRQLESHVPPGGRDPSGVGAGGSVSEVEKTSDGASHPENRGGNESEKNLTENLDRTLISYLTDFPSRMRTLGTTPASHTSSLSAASVPNDGLTSTANGSVRVNSTTTMPPITDAHKITSYAPPPQPSPVLGAAPPPERTNDVQLVGHTKKQKRRHSPTTSVIPVHVKEEKVDDSYDSARQPATKVQIVDVSGSQRPSTVRHYAPVASQGYVVRMPTGNTSGNPLRSGVATSSAGALPSGKFRTMPTYRFSQFRANPTPKNVPTLNNSPPSGTSSLAKFAKFVPLYPQNIPKPRGYQAPVAATPPNPQYLLSNAGRTTPSATPPNPQYLLNNAGRTIPSTMQPKMIAASAPCFIVVNRQTPGTPQIRVPATTYASPASVPTPSIRGRCETAPPMTNGKGARPLKVRPSNTNAALLTRKFVQLYKKSIRPKSVAPKFLPASLHISAPLKVRSCEGCGDEFITERGLTYHYERKSVVISFTCRCDKKAMLFYNMCSFARFYERHTSGDSSKQHSPYDSCVMAMLPPYLMPAEYRRMATADESRREPADATPSTVDGPASSVAKTLSPVVSHDVPTIDQPSIKEFFDLLECRSVKCSECPVTYKRRKGLAAHMSAQRSSRKGEEFLRCTRCCVVLPNACSFRAHARIHDKIEPYVCPECGQTFRSSRDVFMTHVKKVCFHFSRIVRPRCPVCSATLSHPSAETMVAHLETTHSSSYHKCNSCTMAFPSEQSFHGHSLAQHSNGATSMPYLKCPICSEARKDRQSLVVHLGEHVKESGFTQRCFFHCLVCPSSFTVRSDFIDHMRNTHPEETIAGQMCNICGAVCENGVALYGHTKAHHEDFLRRLVHEDINKTDEAPPDAGQAEAAAPTEAGRTATEIGTAKSLECDRCQTVLSDEEQFKRHMAKHRFLETKRAGAKLPETKAKKKRRKEERDDVADKTVQIKSEIKDEVPPTPDTSQSTPVRSSHSTSTSTSPGTVEPEKSSSDCDVKLLWFSCHLCEKTFKNTTDLNQHLKDTHTGKSRQHAYLCWICREQSELKSYPKAGMLVKHLKNFHKIARKNIDYARIALFKNKDEESATSDEAKPAECAESLVRNLRVEGDATYNCAKCEFSSTEREAFLEHIDKHRLGESHQCLECGICFVALPSLKRHLFVVHRVRDFVRYQSEAGISLELVAEPDSDPESFMSPNADGRLLGADAESSFLSEEAESTTSPEKESATLECTVCYRSFVDQWTLRQHMRVHGMAFIQGTRRSNMSRKSALSDS